MSSNTERLATEQNVWVATVRADGRPHLVPIWFVWLNGCIWIATYSNSVKIRNVTENPRASVSLENGNAPIVCEGTVVVHRPPFAGQALESVNAAFVAKYQWDFSTDTDSIVVMQITPVKWLFPGSGSDTSVPV